MNPFIVKIMKEKRITCSAAATSAADLVRIHNRLLLWA